ALVGSVVVSIITCSAEIGGTATVLKYLTGWPYPVLAALTTLALVAIIWALPFKWIERLFGVLGLLMLVFAVSTVNIHPPWAEVAKGFVPQAPVSLPVKDLVTYGYFVVAIISAVLFPYETYFYSSGGVEEQWKPKDLMVNRLVSVVGFGLGSLLAISLLVNAAVLFRPLHIDPSIIGT